MIDWLSASKGEYFFTYPYPSVNSGSIGIFVGMVASKSEECVVVVR